MFRKMRRKEKQMTEEDTIKVLKEGVYANLATISDNGYPYSVPLNYVYKDDVIYFHSATAGHKLDNIKANSKVSLSVVNYLKILPDKFNVQYNSAVVFGKASEVTDEKEKIEALKLIIEKYSKDYIEQGMQYIKKSLDRVSIFKIEIDHKTGKREGNVYSKNT